MKALVQALKTAPDFMRTHQIDGWLVYDFRGSNPVMRQLLPSLSGMSRRGFLLMSTTEDRPILLVHSIEKSHYSEIKNVSVVTYESWQSFVEKLGEILSGYRRVAMEYSPHGELPTASWVDGGTLELIRSWNVEIVSSADLSQVSLNTWSDAASESHRIACRHVVAVKDLAFEYIGLALSRGESPNEFEVQQTIDHELAQRGFETDHPAIVAANANSGNPHYVPQPCGSLHIGRDDWVLIDLWARLPGEHNIFGDITWVGYTGKQPKPLHTKIFDIVRGARDIVLLELKQAHIQGRILKGWELDRVARDFVIAAGYGDYFVHRTGHSLGPGPSVHGLGVNLDDFESKDTRSILPGGGFTVEPGIYLPDFGVRLEINVFINPDSGPELTTPLQDSITII